MKLRFACPSCRNKEWMEFELPEGTYPPACTILYCPECIAKRPRTNVSLAFDKLYGYVEQDMDRNAEGAD